VQLPELTMVLGVFAVALGAVQVFCDGKTVADHERLWAWHQTITDPEHRAAANLLRHHRIGRSVNTTST
jgi:hypothetical protein